MQVYLLHPQRRSTNDHASLPRDDSARHARISPPLPGTAIVRPCAVGLDSTFRKDTAEVGLRLAGWPGRFDLRQRYFRLFPEEPEMHSKRRELHLILPYLPDSL